MTLILQATPPITINNSPALVVATGGGIVGGFPAWSHILLTCPACSCGYLMAAEPRAFALGPQGATVLPGFVERCPYCRHESQAGDVLEVC